MPELNEANIRHLLRRTEFVDRGQRVAELLAYPDWASVVADVTDVVPAPDPLAYASNDNYQRAVQLSDAWLNLMAHDSQRPFLERMALFWHGLLVSSMAKVGSAELMRQQIDWYRTAGLGPIGELVKTMAIQPAMLRYLDNNRNFATSPNQNFGRELLELFLLGVGNYTEADVEAATAAWTGHTEIWQTESYSWRPDLHDATPRTLLGQPVCVGADAQLHGDETVDIVLGSGVVPNDAANEADRGRATSIVAAEFLTRKLWAEFAGTPIPPGVLTELASVLVDNSFVVLPWVTAMFNHDAFYSAEVMEGLVRQPISYAVRLLVATGQRAEHESTQWQLLRAGQRPFYPPSVSGWPKNIVNAGAFDARALLAKQFADRCVHPAEEAGYVQLGVGQVAKSTVNAVQMGEPVVADDELVDAFIDGMDHHMLPARRAAVVDYLGEIPAANRIDALLVVLAGLDMHLA